MTVDKITTYYSVPWHFFHRLQCC